MQTAEDQDQTTAESAAPTGAPVPASPHATTKAAPLDDLGELPRTYGSDLIFLVAQEPHWLFTYWDIDISKHPGGPTYLRVLKADQQEAEIEVPFETRNWYIPAREAGTEYSVEIGYYRNEEWKVIARSAPATTPPERMAESDIFNFATVPLHLSFNALMGNVRNAIQEGESLIQALARLQRDGKLFPEGFGERGVPDNDQLTVLEAILGRSLLEELTSGGLSSAEVQERIREALSEKLSSAGGSEIMSSLSMAGRESSLFGAFGALASGAQVSSWTTAALSSWAAAALTSWMEAAKARASWSGETSSSWGGESSSSWSGETSASWARAAAASWGPSELASWLQAVQSSWGGEQLSSWLQSAQSSWAQAALSSWNQAAFSSWAEAAESSWSGASENVSSFGQAREFFMHVNAEVIFYGGTDPRAKVTIDGKEVQLTPAGTFRYHFIFPDGDYEIPIVATSPDGVETRRAILRFERETARAGHVTDTAQPPLSPPMGAQ